MRFRRLAKTGTDGVNKIPANGQYPIIWPEDQAEADAGRETKRMAAFEPYERLGFLGQGLTGIMGGYGNQYQFQQQPNPTPLQTALGTGATLAGIYGAVRNPGNLQNITGYGVN